MILVVLILVYMKRLMTISTVTAALMGLLVSGGSAFAVTQDSVNTDLNVNVEEVIQLGVGNCGTATAQTVALSVGAGNFSSCSIAVNVGTNAAGYELLMNSVDAAQYSTDQTVTNEYFDGLSDSKTNLVMVTSEGPTVVDTSRTIPPFSATISSPAEMSTAAAWGFAVPTSQGSITGFDASYSTHSNSNTTTTGKYAAVPTTQTVIRTHTGTVNSQNTDVFFGTRASMVTAPGVYKATVLFSAVGEN